MARRGLAGVAVMAALLAAPAVASANDLFVSTGGSDANPCSSTLPCMTVSHAVTVANNDDTIHIGPGSFEGGISTAKRLTFQGVGAGTIDDATGATVIAGAPNQALQMTAGGTLRDLRATGGSSTRDALQLENPSSALAAQYTISGVIALGDNCDCRALTVRDPAFGDHSLLSLNVSDSSFISTGPGAGAVFVQSADANFARVAIGARDQGGGGLLMELGTLAFTDGSIGAPGVGGFGAELAVNAHATFTRTRFGGFNAVSVDGAMAPSDATVSDSLAVGTISGAAVQFGASLTARGSTFAAEGPDAVAAAKLTADTGGNATVTAVNSIFRSPVVDVKTSNANAQVSTFTADHSSYTTVDSSGGGTVTPPGSGTNVSGDPGFANESGGDFRLSAGSALIDRGAAALAGETDISGGARALDGNCDGAAVPDIGAFELANLCPPKPAATAPVLSGVRMTHRRFRVGRPAAARAPRGTRFVYSLSDAATVTITIHRKAAGRKKGRRCVKPRRGLRRHCTRFVRRGAFKHASAAGPNSVAFSGKIRRRALPPGKYRATLVAVGPGGRSKARRLSFTIVRR